MKDNWVYSETLGKLVNLTGATHIEAFGNCPPRVGQGVKVVYFSEVTDIYNRNERCYYSEDNDSAKKALMEIKKALIVDDEKSVRLFQEKCFNDIEKLQDSLNELTLLNMEIIKRGDKP
jgi:hypothetical protein